MVTLEELLLAIYLQSDCNSVAIDDPIYIEDEHPVSGLLEEE